MICHADFTQGNVMVENELSDETKVRRRVGFIDWESHLEGNPFIDLSFILFYGLDANDW